MSRQGTTVDLGEAAPVARAARPVRLACRHEAHERGPCFDYCPDCGAVRSTTRAGQPAGPWHVCDGCQL